VDDQDAETEIAHKQNQMVHAIPGDKHFLSEM
jgi:hypothetical protein